MCEIGQDGTTTVARDDISKTIRLGDSTFIFMSGNYDAVCYAVDIYKRNRHNDLYMDRRAATNALKTMYSTIPWTARMNHNEVAVFYIIRRVAGSFSGELYTHSGDYLPSIHRYVPQSVIVLGSYIPGTDGHIRESIRQATTDHEMVSAFRRIYDEQCRPEVGGMMELFRISSTSGHVQKTKFKITEE